MMVLNSQKGVMNASKYKIKSHLKIRQESEY